MDRNLVSEVFFPNVFRNTPPDFKGWGKNCPCSQQFTDVRVPILKLAHVTHACNETEIITENSYEFEANKKYGRKNHQSRVYRDDAYDVIDHNTLMFPGYYSWWSPCAYEYNIPPEHPQATNCLTPSKIESLKKEGIYYYVPGYLQNPPSSFYGDRVFHLDFQHLLGAYAGSRQCDITEICFRIGGTLRYHYEMCYVVIVCTTGDHLDFALLQPFNDKFEANGLFCDDGRLINSTAIATFHPQNIISWMGGQSYSYATAAFGFYYPDQKLIVTRENTNRSEIKHDPKFCAKMILDKKTYKCPSSQS
jgi:hypothetical protein